MSLSESEIQRIFHEHKKVFEEMEHYDRTREKLWGRKRVYITLNQRILNKLKEIKEKTGKPISHIIEDSLQNIK